MGTNYPSHSRTGINVNEEVRNSLQISGNEASPSDAV